MSKEPNATVQIVEKWGPGFHAKYIPLPDGDFIILELDENEESPFMLLSQKPVPTESKKAGAARSAEGL